MKELPKINKYYVYGAYVDGVLKYVGKGYGNRYKHCMSGKSTCEELNAAYRSGCTIDVQLLHGNLSESEAFTKENEEIEKIGIENLWNKIKGWKSVCSIEELPTNNVSIDFNITLSGKLLWRKSITGPNGLSVPLSSNDKIILAFMSTLTPPISITNDDIARYTGIEPRTVLRSLAKMYEALIVEKETITYQNLPRNVFLKVNKVWEN